MVISTHVDMSNLILENQVAIRASGNSLEPGDGERVLPLLKVLSEPNRLSIYTLLTQGECCVCDIEADVRLPQNLVSHHLGVLREAGLILSRKQGRWVHYSINREKLAEVYPVICRLFNPECVSDASNACCHISA